MGSPAAAAAVVAAELAVARQKTRQALGACRTATQRLAQAHSIDTYAHRSCTCARDVDDVAAVIHLAIAEHGDVDVVVIATPRQ